MRTTIHLTSARDAQILRTQMLLVLERNLLTGTRGSSALRRHSEAWLRTKATSRR